MAPRGAALGDEHAEVGPISTAVGQHALGLDDRRQPKVSTQKERARARSLTGRAAETRQSESNADHLRSRAGCGHPATSHLPPRLLGWQDTQP